jgi:predicted phage terminase large subunit-like protein
MNNSLLLLAFLRSDFLAFLEKCFVTLEPGLRYQDNWHIWALAEALRHVQNDPRKRIICVSYSESLAKAHAAAFRTIVKSSWYREAFPAFQIRRGGDREVETITTELGYRYAVSIAGPVLGRGADLIIGDDPMSPVSALSEATRTREINLWMGSHRSRLNNKLEGAIILVMQRLHEQDLVGHVRGSEDWDQLVIPAISPEAKRYLVGPGAADFYDRAAEEVLHPDREPREVLDATRRALGSLTFSAQYLQDPIPPGGNVIKRSWLRFYDEPPSEFDRVIASWDTASTLAETSDWSVGTVWGAVGQDFYLLHVRRERLETPDLRRAIVDLDRDWSVDVTLIEHTELGRAIAQDLRAARTMRPLLERAHLDKLARLLAVSARFEAGQVLLPREAPWLGVYMAELLAFPAGQHDDQVDATSQALRYLTFRQAPLNDLVRRETVRRNIPRRTFVNPPRRGET